VTKRDERDGCPDREAGGECRDKQTVGPSQAAAITYYCPRCHQMKLEVENTNLCCPACHQSYPVVNGIPVLINNANSVFAVEDYLGAASYVGASRPPQGLCGQTGYRSEPGHATGLRAAYRRFARALGEKRVTPPGFSIQTAIANVSRDTAVRPRVLVIGAGDVRRPESADFVYTDVAYSRGLHAIVDAHDLPFDDSEFDLVLAVSVLEHVADPQRVVDEIWRVLKRQGCVFADTPFLAPVHMGAYDFTRYTYLGHRRLFRRFADLASGMDLGPGTVLAWSTQSLLLSLSTNQAYRSMAKLVALLMAVPIKYLDYITRHNPAAIDGAGGVFFFGRKQETTISDRELIKLYRGGFTRKTAP